MTDLHNYESLYFVHTSAEEYYRGSEYLDLKSAMDMAKDDALAEASDMEITHVMMRTVKRVRVTVEVDDV